jgi:membrane-associated phospholipid phosphatase
MLAGIFTAGWRSPLLRSGAFLTSVLLLGPGLIVNVILKSHWGRARPDDIVNFGGQLSYSKVWVIAHECSRNCSFVSGEGAASFALLAISFIVPSAYRRRVAFAALLVALVISTCRIMFGGHFLSDTLLSWLIVLLVILVLDRYINRGPWIAAPTISDTLSPSGRR